VPGYDVSEVRPAREIGELTAQGLLKLGGCGGDLGQQLGAAIRPW
jgi:hypothetical protein